MERRRILFLSENVTWSQVVRLLVLARGLDPAAWDVHFACASFDETLFRGTDRLRRWPIHSMDRAKVDAALAGGKRLYEKAILQRYVDDERRLFDAVRPDVVVSDLRWSTSISAPVSGVPCLSLVNAYWSPHVVRERFPLPEHPIVKLLGVPMAERYFPMAIPRVFAHFTAPVNELRKKHGLPEVGSLLDLMTWGDRVLFPDDPILAPLAKQPANHVFLGPVVWSPDVPAPAWLDSVGTTRPLVYATLGSSGPIEVLPTVLEALSAMDVDVVLASAGRSMPSRVPPNVRVVDVAPGDRLARRASVVICNGGASTGYQALAEGTPIVGIPFNLDAYLAMTAMRDAGAGVLVRSGTITAREVRAAVDRAMNDSAMRSTAKKVAASFARWDPHARFASVLDDVLGRTAIAAPA